MTSLEVALDELFIYNRYTKKYEIREEYFQHIKVLLLKMEQAVNTGLRDARNKFDLEDFIMKPVLKKDKTKVYGL